MIRRLFRTGRTLAVGVPEATAKELGLHSGDFVTVESDPATGAVVIWPVAARERVGLRPEYLRHVGEFLAVYGPALAALERVAADQEPAAGQEAPG